MRVSWVQQEDSALRAFVANLDPARPGQGPFKEHYDQRQAEMLARGRQFVVLPCDTSSRPPGRTWLNRRRGRPTVATGPSRRWTS